MRRMMKLVYLCAVLCVFMGCADSLFALAKEYERNGEVYVLVGDGPKIGVYRLNDPAGEGVPLGWLYNPLDSYGISVNLTRKVFTFSESLSTQYVMLPGNILVKMKKVGDTQLQDYHMDHRGNWGEAGTDMYTTPGGSGWYRDPSAWLKVVNPMPNHFGGIPNGKWYQSFDNDRYGRPGKCYRDRVEGKERKYNLLEWYQGIAGNNPADKGTKATAYDQKIQRALLGSCIDPCGTDNQNLTLNAATQTVSLALSSFGRTYCYTRSDNSTTDGKVTLDNVDFSGAMIGMMNDLTTKWIGVSLRSTTNDFVYLLGTEVIKSWLTQLGYAVPPAFNITAVSVSDQWYLKGGIVFAYNAANGIAYQFTRADNADGTASGTSYFTSVNLGTGIDDIKADGFGNLYFAKTSKFPVDGSGFSPADVSAIQWTSVSTDMNRATGRLIYDQKVTKSVYRRALGATTFSLVGSVNLGNDKWERYFWVPLTLTSGASYLTVTPANWLTISTTPDWHWVTPTIVKDPSPSVGLPTRVQVGVINVAAPPKPLNATGVLDIVGPTNSWQSSDVPQGLYTFRVENAPEWERDDFNKKYYDPLNPTNATDENSNGTIGGFPSTASKAGSDPSSMRSDHVLYTWVVYQVKDAYGNDIPATIVKNSGSVIGIPSEVTSPEIKHYFTAGVYQIMCHARYRYYNYDKLPFGSTVLDKPSALEPFREALVPPKPASVNTTNYPTLAAIPSNYVVQMLKVNVQAPIATGSLAVDIYRKLPSETVFSAPLASTQGKYHAIDEVATHNWKISPENLLFDLPTITDSNKVGAVRWSDPVAYYTWSFNLVMPDNSPFPMNLPPKNTANSADTAVTFGIPIPTDPRLGTLQCDAYRSWEYDYRAYNSDGSPAGIKTKTGTVQYRGTCKVLVRDKTPPTVISLNSGSLNAFSLKGTTGDPLTATNGNPTNLTIVVRDNNPFANLNETCPIPGVGVHNRNLRQTATIIHETNGAGKNAVPINTLASFTSPSVASVTMAQFHTALINNAGALPTANITIGNRTITAAQMRQIASYSSPTLAQQSDALVSNNYRLKRTLRSVPAGSTYSEIEYQIPISDIQHFQSMAATQSTSVNYHANLPVNFANNQTGYNNPGNGAWVNTAAHDGYGINFVACDSSGNEMKNAAGLTFIDVVDNRHPVACLSITELKGNTTHVVPFNIQPQLTNYDFFVKAVTQAHTWQPGNDGVFLNCFNPPFGTKIYGLPTPPLAAVTGLDGMFPTIISRGIEAGVEVDFTLQTNDNIQVAAAPAPYFRIVGPEAASAYYAVGSTQETIPGSSVTQFRHVFRQPGIYDVTLYAEDTALDYNKSAKRNTRTVRFGLVIVPTTLDIRVIDRETNRR